MICHACCSHRLSFVAPGVECGFCILFANMLLDFQCYRNWNSCYKYLERSFGDLAEFKRWKSFLNLLCHSGLCNMFGCDRTPFSCHLVHTDIIFQFSWSLRLCSPGMSCCACSLVERYPTFGASMFRVDVSLCQA
jgi:hypothetical protein